MGGSKVKNLDTMSSSYICRQCSLLLRDPVQLIDCGHRMCQSCSNELNEDMIVCPTCHESTTRDKLIIDRGFRNDMQTLVITCSLCDWTDVLKKYQNHLEKAHPNPICTYCSQQFISVNDLDQHQQFNCPKITVDCPLKTFGCEEMILRVDLPKHFVTERHQTSLIRVIRYLKTGLPSQMNNQLHQTTTMVTNQLEEFKETIDILEGGIQVLRGDVQRLKDESLRHQNESTLFIRDIPILNKSIEEQNAFVNGMKTNQDIIEQDLSSMKQKLDDLKSTSYDGILIWKITNVKQRMDDAQAERQTSFYSPPFYSSPTGYKMCLRLYLYGDGNARRTHMSIFFVLMRGEFDPILRFPFCYKVTFCLYNQIDQQNHIIDSFRPDIKSNSFQRPRSDMNIASGIPKFVPLTTIQQENNPYIRDDTMFIKVMVDFADIPTTVLPYALSLSPALTIQTQQTMIRQEIEKLQQQQTSNTSTTINETNEPMGTT